MINQSPLALDKLDIEYPSEDNGYTLSIKLPDGSDKYYMTFRTSIEGEKIVETFKNEAIFENGSRVRNLKASVTNKHGNSFVNKSGKQNGDMINWSVVINESQSTIRNAVLKDSPSKNQIILENSFVIYKIEMNDDGSHKPNYNEVLQKGVDYELEILNHADGSQQVMVSFLNLIEDAYLMQYDSQINATENDLQIVNKIELSGNGITYVDDKGASSFKIDVSSAGGSATGTKGKLSIQKLGEGDLPLEGVVFELYNSKGNLVSRQTTDEDGNVDFRNLLYGTYTLKEISSLSGYVISDILFEGIDVAVNAQSSLETSRQELNNYMNKLIINKKDVAGRLLDGAVFTLEKKVNDTYEVITDNLVLTQGELVLKGYDAGYYRLTETQAPEGYILNTEVIDFEIKLNANDQAIDETVDVINYQGSVRLTKVDENQKLLEGVYYDLYDGNDKLVHKDLVTDVNGEIALLNSLQPGTYYFKETKSVEGNLVNETPITFDIPESFSGEPVEVSRSASNAKAAIEFKKTAGSNLGLPGAVFEIGHVDGLIPVQTVVSDTDGMVRVNQLVPGDYWIKEIQAPKGYLLNLEQGTFNIPEVTNVENYFETLADFENYQGSVELEKKDSSGKVLEGVVYKLYKDQDELIDTYTTNKQGIIAVDGLEPGDYYFKEVSSVGGNIANENPIPFKIVTEANNAPELVKLTAVNGKASVQFSKTDAQGNPLAGATFNLYNKDTDKLVTSVQSDDQGLVKVDHLSPGNYYFKEVEAPESYVINTATPSFNIPEKTTGDNYTLILDDAFVNYQASVQFKKVNVQGEALEGVGFKLFSIIDGKVSSTAISTAYSDVDGLVFFDHLGSGDYIIREFSTLDCYYLNTQEIPFTIDAAYNGAVDTLELENYINHKAVIEFKKTDVYGNALSGAHFDLINSKGDVVDSAISNKDGVVRFEDVAVGDYTIEETQGITGYILNKDIISLSIEKEAEGKPEVILLEDFVNYQGQIQFYKHDVNGNGLEGAEFTVYDTLGNAVQTVSSDKQGLVSFMDLPVGKYSVSETKAPNGYVRNTQTQVFEIYQESVGEPEVLVLQNIVNYKGSVMLHKVNDTGHFINGARFELYDENNKLVRKIVVESGLYHIQDLAPGNYTLLETHAPVGYRIDNAKTQFTIQDTSDGTYVYETLKVVNQLDGLPGTGIGSNYNLYLVMIVIGILFIALRTSLKRKY